MKDGKPLIIYVAGPYSAPTAIARLKNTYRAIVVGVKLILKGHIPFIPHLTHWVDSCAKKVIGRRLRWDFWMAYDMMWLEKCDAIFFIASSPGADRERKKAMEMGMKIFYELDEVWEVDSGKRICNPIIGENGE